MSSGEKAAFIGAVLAIKANGVYDQLVQIHIDRNGMDYKDKDGGLRIGHVDPGFLPWHRQFLLLFEQELQKINPMVTLPYWDWTTDNTVNSPLWRPSFMGGTGRSGDLAVRTGPFARQNGWVINTSVTPIGEPFLNGNYTVDTRDYLTRELGVNIDRLPTPKELQDTVNLSVYDEAPWSYTSGGQPPYNSFRNHLEGYVTFPWEPATAKLHSRGHRWVGGHMRYIASPNDPVFFMHHAQVDRIWTLWQEAHPDVPHYLPVEETADVPSLHTKLAPWSTMSPADLIDHKQWYIYEPSVG
jgi:tyrosinase